MLPILSVKYYCVAVFFVLAIYMYAGLNGGFARIENKLEVDEDSGGLIFRRDGLAHTSPKVNVDLRRGYELALKIELDEYSFKRGGQIINISSGSKETQLTLWQYKNQLIFMQGSDFDYKKKKPRIYINLDKEKYIDKPIDLRVHVDRDKSTISVQLLDELRRNKKSRSSSFFSYYDRAYFLLGNDIKREHGWSGKIYSVILRNVHNNETLFEFNFDSVKDDTRQRVNSGNLATVLYFPAKHQLLEKRFFSSIEQRLNMRNIGKADLALNFFGFIPWGVFICIFFFPKLGVKRAFLTAFLSGFLISLCIELMQGYLPSRDSSQVDLLLNTLGTLVGASFVFVAHRITKVRSR